MHRLHSRYWFQWLLPRARVGKVAKDVRPSHLGVSVGIQMVAKIGRLWWARMVV